MTVVMHAVDADDPRLDRLLQLYMHEWTGLFHAVPAHYGSDARFVYPELPHYRDRSSHEAYLYLDADRGKPIGFALSMRDDQGRWHVEEFFILAGARRHGAGGAAARALFATHPGRWTLTVRPENPGALGFWRAVASAGADEQIEVGADGIARTRLSFVVPHA